MTGRDLIVYILENGLENEQVFYQKGFLNFLTAKEAAIKFSVGESTIKVWHHLGMLDGLTINGELYISPISEPHKK